MGTIDRIMGKPICAVPLPPELQRELPAGALVYSFDGELIFRSKNPNLNQEPRTYSLLPVTDNAAMYERRWPGHPMQDTYLPVEHFHGHTVTMFFFYFPPTETAVGGLSRTILPMVKQAAQGSQLSKELFSAAEKILPGAEPESGPTYRTAAFAAVSWSTHQWIWINSTLAAGFVFEGPVPITKLLAKSMFTRNFVGKRLDQNDRNTTTIDALVMWLRRQMDQQLAQNSDATGRL